MSTDDVTGLEHAAYGAMPFPAAAGVCWPVQFHQWSISSNSMIQGAPYLVYVNRTLCVCPRTFC